MRISNLHQFQRNQNRFGSAMARPTTTPPSAREVARMTSQLPTGFPTGLELPNGSLIAPRVGSLGSTARHGAQLTRPTIAPPNTIPAPPKVGAPYSKVPTHLPSLRPPVLTLDAPAPYSNVPTHLPAEGGFRALGSTLNTWTYSNFGMNNTSYLY